MVADPPDATYVVANGGDDTIRFYDTSGERFSPYHLPYMPAAIACINFCIGVLALSDSGSAVEMTSTGNVLQPGAFAGLNHPSAAVEAVLPNSKTIYVANHGNDTIGTYDEQGHSIPVKGSFPGLSAPVSITWAGQDLFVTNSRNSSVTEYDLDGNPVTLPAGAFPDLQSPSAITEIPNAQCYY